MSRVPATVLRGCLLSILMSSPVLAQLGGHNIVGDTGLQSSSQAPPGFYLSGIVHTLPLAQFK